MYTLSKHASIKRATLLIAIADQHMYTVHVHVHVHGMQCASPFCRQVNLRVMTLAWFTKGASP